MVLWAVVIKIYNETRSEFVKMPFGVPNIETVVLRVGQCASARETRALSSERYQNRSGTTGWRREVNETS